jgi:hypothetical protein
MLGIKGFLRVLHAKQQGSYPTSVHGKQGALGGLGGWRRRRPRLPGARIIKGKRRGAQGEIEGGGGETARWSSAVCLASELGLTAEVVLRRTPGDGRGLDGTVSSRHSS